MLDSSGWQRTARLIQCWPLLWQRRRNWLPHGLDCLQTKPGIVINIEKRLAQIYWTLKQVEYYLKWVREHSILPQISDLQSGISSTVRGNLSCFLSFGLRLHEHKNWKCFKQEMETCQKVMAFLSVDRFVIYILATSMNRQLAQFPFNTKYYFILV